MTDVAPAENTADVRIRIGRPFEVMSDERRAATAEFAEELRSSGLTVDLAVTEYVPGKRGLGPVEWTFITLGVAKALDLVVDGAKALLRRRQEAKKESGSAGPPLGFIIYGPDGEKRREWTTREDETDPE